MKTHRRNDGKRSHIEHRLPSLRPSLVIALYVNEKPAKKEKKRIGKVTSPVTDEQVIEVRRLREMGLTTGKIAEAAGVPHAYVKAIVYGEVRAYLQPK